MLAWVLFGVLSAAPQSDVVFTTLGIDLWPDYDQPGVLVIYRANIAPGVALPAQVTFRIPAAAGPPTAVAERQTDGELVTLSFERRVEGDAAFIELTATRPVVQLEYYDPALERDGVQRSFTFTWPGDYEVGALSVSAQQPDLAQNLTTTPAAATRAPGNDGLVYHTIALAAVAAGDVVDVQLSYEKASDQLSVETMVFADPIPSAPVVVPRGEIFAKQIAVIVMAALVVIGIVAGVATVARSRRRTARSGGFAAGAADGAARFCTQCGEAGRPDDRYCHGCGTALR
jgi:hypothetical protein